MAVWTQKAPVMMMARASETDTAVNTKLAVHSAALAINTARPGRRVVTQYFDGKDYGSYKLHVSPSDTPSRSLPAASETANALSVKFQ
jgi:hypothetical protein